MADTSTSDSTTPSAGPCSACTVTLGDWFPKLTGSALSCISTRSTSTGTFRFLSRTEESFDPSKPLLTSGYSVSALDKDDQIAEKPDEASINMMQHLRDGSSHLSPILEGMASAFDPEKLAPAPAKPPLETSHSV